jgi:putative sugar O-methyltransferase
MKAQDLCYDASDMWKRIHSERFPSDPAACIDDFKSGDVNFKIAVWDPRTSGLRYLKTLIFNLCAGLQSSHWEALSRIQNRSTGKPITIRYRNEDVCMDYLQAVLELQFIAPHVPLNGAHVLEIGGGYGRTCHAFLSNHSLASYTIVDLAPCLALARVYLVRVLSPDQFACIRFCSVDDFARLSNPSWTLCLNIDSFAEMDENVVKSYLHSIDTTCDWFYVKNPVGKYMDKSLDNHADGTPANRHRYSRQRMRQTTGGTLPCSVSTRRRMGLCHQ